MTYNISIDKKAQKFILKQPKNKQLSIYKAIYNLPSGDIKQLQGHKDYYRLRVGDYRIIYFHDNGKYQICVIDAGNRGDIYKRYRTINGCKALKIRSNEYLDKYLPIL